MESNETMTGWPVDLKLIFELRVTQAYGCFSFLSLSSKMWIRDSGTDGETIDDGAQ